MDSYIFAAFALCYAMLFIWGIRKHSKTPSAILLLVVAALIYDNAILALGHLIGAGDLLYVLNVARFWIHALVTPLLILFCYFVLVEADVSFVKKPFVRIAFIVWTIIAIVVEYFVELRSLSLQLQQQYGVISYASEGGASGPPPMILIVLAALLFTAIVLIKQRRWWWLLIGAIVMTIGSAIPLDVPSNAITNAFELFLLCMLMKTAIHFSNRKRNLIR